MLYLLDTNICIFAMRRNDAVLSRLESLSPDEIAVSSITLAELRFGAAKSQHPKKNRGIQDAFLAPLKRLDFDWAAAEKYGDLRQFLESKGLRIGERDLMIASIAVARRCVLVTNNVREFSRVPKLTVDDWSL